MNERNDTGGFLSLRKYLRGVCEELLQLLFGKRLRFKPCVVRLTEFNRLEDIKYVFQIVFTARTEEPSEILLCLLTGDARFPIPCSAVLDDIGRSDFGREEP